VENDTPEDYQRQKNLTIICEILQTDYVSLSFKESTIMESEGKSTHIECVIKESSGAERLISGTGLGAVDALFNALIKTYMSTCITLEDIVVQEFHIFVDRTDLRRRHRTGHLGADALVNTCLVINNGLGPIVPFRSQNTSAVRAMLDVVLSAIEFYINSEQAVRRLREYIEDARSRRRQDLVEFYTSRMVDLVKNVSYERVLRGVDEN